MLRYITWKRVKINDNYFIDPNTNWEFEKATKDSKFTETPYQLNDWRFISIVEYPNETTQEQIDLLISAYSAFNFTFITEIEANNLLSELWEVSVKDFVFSDNRPINNLLWKII
jgi:hypothetical protein